MLKSLLVHLLLIIAALALVITPAVIVVSSSTDWAHRRVQEIAARQMADMLGREVRVGPVRGNLLSGFSIDGIAVAEHQRLADGALFTVDRMHIVLDLVAVIKGQLPPARAVSLVELHGMHVRVERYSDGRMNVTELFPPAPEPTPVEEQFAGIVRLHDATVVYVDESPYVRTGRMEITARRIMGEINLNRPQRPEVHLSADIDGGIAQALKVHLVSDAETGFFGLDADIANVDAAWAVRTFVPGNDVNVHAGRVSARGSVYVVPVRGKNEFDFSARAVVHNLLAEINELGSQPVAVDGELWAGMDGVHAETLQVSWAGNTIDLSGHIADFTDPLLDIAFVTEQFSPHTVRDLLPPDTLPDGWDAVFATSPALQGDIIGPVANMDIRARAQLPSVTLDSPATDPIRIADLTLNAEIVDTGAPIVNALAHTARVEPPDLSSLLAQPDLTEPANLRVGAVDDVSARIFWQAGAAAVQSALYVPYVHYNDIEVENITFEAAFDGQAVAIRDLQAEALGGRIFSDAVIFIDDETVRAGAAGRIERIQLAALAGLGLDLDQPLSGLASADFHLAHDTSGTFLTSQAAVTDGVFGDIAVNALSARIGAEFRESWSAAAALSAGGLLYEDIAVSSADALVEFDGSDIFVRGAVINDPRGVIWAQGKIPVDPEEPLEVAFRTAEVNLQAIEEFVDNPELESVAGIAYISGTAAGTLKEPEIEAKVHVFSPVYGEYELAALTVDARYHNDIVEVRDMYATRDSAALHAFGTVRDVRGPIKDAALAMHVDVQGVDLQNANEFLKEPLPIDGLAEVAADISGTVGEPYGKGIVRLSNARFREFFIDQAEVHFVGDTQQVQVTDARLNFQDATVNLQGAVRFSEPIYLEATLASTDIHIEGIVPLLGADVHAAGTVQVPEAWISGPVNNLHGGGRIIAAQLEIADEEITEVDMRLAMQEGEITLERTRFSAAEGDITLSATYNYASTTPFVNGDVVLSQTDIPRLIELTQAIVTALPVAERETPPQELIGQLQSMALRLQGRLDSTFTVSGPTTDPVVNAAIDMTDMRLDNKAVPDISGTAVVSKNEARDIDLTLLQGDALITVYGDMVFDGEINAIVDGSNIDMVQVRPWVPLEFSMGGRLGFTVVAQGQTQSPQVQASVDIVNPSYAGVRFDILSVPIATLSEGALEVDSLIAKRGDQEIVVDGMLPFSWQLPTDGENGSRPGLDPEGEVRLTGRIENTVFAFFPPLIDDFMRTVGSRDEERTPGASTFWGTLKAEGTVNSTLALSGPLNAMQSSGFVRLEGGSLLPEDWENPLTPLNIDIELAGTGTASTAEFKTFAFGYDGIRGDLTGDLRLASLNPDDLKKASFNLDLTIAGESQTVPGGTVLRDIGGTLTARTDPSGAQVVSFDGFGARVGDGNIALNGQAELSIFELERIAENRFDLQFSAGKAKIRYQNIADLLLDGTLSVTNPRPGAPATVLGRFEVNHGTLGIPATGGGGEPAPMRAADMRMPRPNIDVLLAIGQDVQVRAPGVTAPLEPNREALKISGTPQHPSVTGLVRARRGSTTLPTGVIKVERLEVTYALEPDPADRGDPVALKFTGFVSGYAETEVRSADVATIADRPILISLDISGPLPDGITVRASSDPPLSETQIYALLGGIPFQGVPGAGVSETSLAQIVSEQFMSTLAVAFKLAVFQPLEEELKRRFGLHELTISFAFEQPVSVKVGKYILENLLVTYEHVLADGRDQYTLNVAYELKSGIRVSYRTDENSRSRFEVGYAFDF